jgi:23S rRNA (guanosine2251-2'-O)-methyltransferase
MGALYSHLMKNNVGSFTVRKCVNEECGLRFTLLADDPRGVRCPICRSETEQIGMEYARNEIVRINQQANPAHLEVMLDNVRSAWNVGSMIRTADGAGVKKVHLCGVTPTPEHPRVPKTSLGAERIVEWSFHSDGVAACCEMSKSGYRIWALEGGERAEPLFSVGSPWPGKPILLVVGNELTGVDPGILELCERVVSLPMLGYKGSLNVAVAFGIAVYWLCWGRL